jgi:acyl-[acyl-carrier-protein] desaturase
LPQTPLVDSQFTQAEIFRLYREYFDHAEKKRRWSLKDDIPWHQCTRTLNPAVAEVVQTFCSVELYLPDYLAKLLPQVRAARGRAWFLCNWGYEESKHALALADWLVRSGQRTDEQMGDLDTELFQKEWHLPYDNALGMVCYTVFQELATWLHYKNLRKVLADNGGDPALDKVLLLLSVDERAHYDFFMRLVRIYLEVDRPMVLEQLRRVVNTFQMPAVWMFADSRQRVEAVRSMRIFDEELFLYKVVEPALAALGVHRSEIRQKKPRESVSVGARTASAVS